MEAMLAQLTRDERQGCRQAIYSWLVGAWN